MYEERFRRNLMNMGQPTLSFNGNQTVMGPGGTRVIAPPMPSIPQGVQPGGVGLQPGQYAPGASGPHPGVETGYMPKGTMNPIPTYNPSTGKYDIGIGMGGRIPQAGGSKIDMAKVEQLLQDIAGMSFPGSYGAGGGEGGGGGGSGAGGGGGIGQIDPMSPVVPGLGSLAPNTGFRRVLPRRPEDDISGGK